MAAETWLPSTDKHISSQPEPWASSDRYHAHAVTDCDSQWRSKVAVFCIVQGIPLVLAPVVDSNVFTWLCNLVAMALQFDQRPGKAE